MPTVRSIAVLSAGLLLIPAKALAQEQDAQLWTTLTAEIEVADDLAVDLTNVVRAGDEDDGVYEIEIGGDLAWKPREGLTISAGYLYVPNYADGDLTTREHRVRQQVSLGLGAVAGGTLSGRLRLEQRWRDDGDDVLLRLRPRLSWSLPVGPDELKLILGHESFLLLNDTDWNGDARYERMRNTIALSRELGAGFSGEIGYLNQYGFRDAGDTMDHVLTLSVTFSR